MKQESTNGSEARAVQAREEPVASKGKRVYVTPVLKRLGSVRELTLGGGKSHTNDLQHHPRVG